MSRFFVTTTLGFEPELARDVHALTGRPVTPERGRVHVEGPWDLAYTLNHGCRAGQRVFLTAAEAEVDALDDVERATRDVAWEDVFPGTKRFAVRGLRVGEHPFTSMDVAARVGDGIIRRFLDATGERPPVDLNAPEVEVHAILRDRHLLLGINTTGPTLHYRAYRTRRHPAPLGPHLAASLLHACGFADEPGPLGDPLTGSGTVPIEAALLARRIPPGRLRPDFRTWRAPSPGEEREEAPHRARAVEAQHPDGYLFGHLRAFDPAAWAAARARLDAGAREACPPLWGNDRKARHVHTARVHARQAGVGDDVTFTKWDARTVEAPFPVRYVVLNPPYGVRVGEHAQLDRLYAKLEERLSAWAAGGPLSVAVIVGNQRFEKAWAREPTWARDATYGRLTVRVLRYDL